MVQNPKGGGLSSSFGGGGTQSLGGVQKTTDFLDKSTWTLSNRYCLLYPYYQILQFQDCRKYRVLNLNIDTLELY